MNKLTTLAAVLLISPLFFPVSAFAESSHGMKSNVRSSTQAISRAVSRNVRQALGLYWTRSNLNMRVEPQGEIIQTLPKGTEVTVLENSGGDWWQVTANERDGWVHSGYLEKNEP